MKKMTTALAFGLDIKTLVLAVSCLALTALGAQVRIPLWFTPVPLTGQVFGVLCTGLLLHSKSAALVQSVYVSFGVLGIPWFAMGGSGVSYLFGPTGGYLIGFILAAYVIAALRFRSARAVAAAAGVLVIYAVGTIWFAGYLASLMHLSVPAAFQKALALGVAPFVTGDVLKILLAVSVSVIVSPRSGSPGTTR